MTKNMRLALAASLALTSGSALAAGERYFLYVEGIPGTSLESPSLANYNEIASWSLGFTRGVCQALSVTKYLNAASPEFTAGALLGTIYPTATLLGRRSGDFSPNFNYMKITLTNVIVSSISNGGSEGNPNPTESIALQPSTVKIEIFEPSSTGGPGTVVGTTTVNCQKPK